jgi:hypothetical protein
VKTGSPAVAGVAVSARWKLPVRCLAHLTRELGYAEQSVLSRSCRRWFGCGPNAYRKAARGDGPPDAQSALVAKNW